MKSKLALGTLTIIATLIGSGAALAQEYKTREQVKAELAEANRAGTVLSGDGTLWSDLGSPLYLASAALAGKTREQVKAELAEGNRNGTILSGDGTLWQDLGALQRFTSTSFVAQSKRSHGAAVMAGTDRSPDSGSSKN